MFVSRMRREKFIGVVYQRLEKYTNCKSLEFGFLVGNTFAEKNEDCVTLCALVRLFVFLSFSVKNSSKSY